MEQDAPWDEIARLYRDPSMPISAILTEYGLTRGQLAWQARKRKWPPRGKPASTKRKPRKPAPKTTLKTGAAAGATAAKGGGGKTVKPRDLVKRFYNTIDKELTKLEGQTGASSQDRERASRALSQMVTSLEKAVEMQREITKDKERTPSGARDKEALVHAEELRREIADRLERLHRKRAASR